MSNIRQGSLHLNVGLRQRMARSVRAVRRQTRADFWFPHGPMFLLVGGLGLMLLRHALGVGGLGHVSAQEVLALSKGALDAVVHGAPSATAGVFLLVMAFGLLTRSRLSWVIAVLATLVSMTLIWLVWTGGAAGNRGLLAYGGVVLLALLVFGRSFGRTSLASATLFAVVSIVLLVAYAVLGTYLLGAEFSPPITDLVTALYFAVVTMSTVGYGDIAPKTGEARLFAISVMIFGITVFATSISALLVPLINRRMEHLLGKREEKLSRSNHYVIVGDSALARNTHKELKARDLSVTFILAHSPERHTEEYDVVLGDASDLEVLRRADVADARAVLALGSDDAENAFVVMAVKELTERARTVAVVNDSRNMDRVRRVRPDVVLAPQVLGGELLAMALSGEAVDSDVLMQRLLHFST